MSDISIHVVEDRTFSSFSYVDMDDGDDEHSSPEFAKLSVELSLYPNSKLSEEMALDLLDRSYMEVRMAVVQSGPATPAP